ncbi:alcohol oxidase [Tylopilus felleus]
MYTRAAASHYDDWETTCNNPGWGSKDLLPLLRKTETYEVKEHEPTHGYSAPLKVSYGGCLTNIGIQALDVATKYDPAHKHRMIAKTYRRAMPTAWIDGKTGRRSDSAHGFVHNQEGNTNLRVLSEKAAMRVLIEDGRGTGVEYTNDLTLNPSADRTIHIAKALLSSLRFSRHSREIGHWVKILSRLNIPQVAELPGVGENYLEQMKSWKHDGTGLVSHTACDVALKLRQNVNDLRELGPDFSTRWKFFESNPDKLIVLLVPCAGYDTFKLDHALPTRKYIGACYLLICCVLLGSARRVHIRSAHDPQERSKMREWIRRMPHYRDELQLKHPVFPAGSAAECRETDGPVPMDSPDIVYTAENDKAIDDFHKAVVTSARHSLGICALKPRQQGGVVDPRLNVYGVRGLKVADLSIAPLNVASVFTSSYNTHSSALVIGDNAATIIGEELAIKNV